MQQKKKQKNKSVPLKSWAKYSGLAFQIGAIIALGIFGGFKLDHLIDIKFPVFLLLSSFLSVGIAIYIAIKDL